MKNKAYLLIGKVFRFGFALFIIIGLSSCVGYRSAYNMDSDGIYTSNNLNRFAERNLQSSAPSVAVQQQTQRKSLPQAQARQVTKNQQSDFNTNFFADELRRMERNSNEELMDSSGEFYSSENELPANNSQMRSSWRDNGNVIVNVNPGFGYQNSFFNHFNRPFWGFNTFYGDPWFNTWGPGFNTWNVGFNRWNGFNGWHVGFNNFGWGWNRPLWNNFYRRPFVNQNRFFRRRNVNRRARTLNRGVYRRSNRPRASANPRVYNRSSRLSNRRNFSRQNNQSSSRADNSQSRRNVRSNRSSQVNQQRSGNQTRRVERRSIRSQRSIRRSNAPRSSNRSYRRSGTPRSSNRSYRGSGSRR